jgi:hypothetical protein
VTNVVENAEKFSRKSHKMVENFKKLNSNVRTRTVLE